MIINYKKRHSILFRAIALAVVCAFLFNDFAFGLAPELRLKQPQFEDQYKLGYTLLAHKAVNAHIRSTLPPGGIDELLSMNSKRIQEDYIHIEMRYATIEQKILIVSVPELLKKTGQLAHIGLGRANRLPVIYIDSNYFSNDILREHEKNKIEMWQDESNRLGKDHHQMREWILDPKTHDKARAFANRVDRKASPKVRQLYKAAKSEIDLDSIYTFYCEYGLNKGDKDINLAAHETKPPKDDLQAVLNRIPPAAESAIKCVVFDYGNVVRRFSYEPAEDELSQLAGIPKEKAREFFARRETDETNPVYKLECENISLEEFTRLTNDWLRPISRKALLPDDVNHIMGLVLSPVMIQETVDLMKALISKGYVVRVLTNTNAVYYSTIVSDLKDVLVNGEKDIDASHLNKPAKPHPESFGRVTKGFKPEESLVVDDADSNTQAAAQLGINTYQFNPEKVFDSVCGIVDVAAKDAPVPPEIPAEPHTGGSSKGIITEILMVAAPFAGIFFAGTLKAMSGEIASTAQIAATPSLVSAIGYMAVMISIVLTVVMSVAAHEFAHYAILRYVCKVKHAKLIFAAKGIGIEYYDEEITGLKNREKKEALVYIAGPAANAIMITIFFGLFLLTGNSVTGPIYLTCIAANFGLLAAGSIPDCAHIIKRRFLKIEGIPQEKPDRSSLTPPERQGASFRRGAALTGAGGAFATSLTMGFVCIGTIMLHDIIYAAVSDNTYFQAILNKHPILRRLYDAFFQYPIFFEPVQLSLVTSEGLHIPVPAGQVSPIAHFAEGHAAGAKKWVSPRSKEWRREQAWSALKPAIESLSPRESALIKFYYGLDGKRQLTAKELARRFRVPEGRIRQIIEKAIRKLQHPLRSKRILASLFKEESDEGASAEPEPPQAGPGFGGKILSLLVALPLISLAIVACNLAFCTPSRAAEQPPAPPSSALEAPPVLNAAQKDNLAQELMNRYANTIDWGEEDKIISAINDLGLDAVGKETVINNLLANLRKDDNTDKSGLDRIGAARAIRKMNLSGISFTTASNIAESYVTLLKSRIAGVRLDGEDGLRDLLDALGKDATPELENQIANELLSLSEDKTVKDYSKISAINALAKIKSTALYNQNKERVLAVLTNTVKDDTLTEELRAAAITGIGKSDLDEVRPDSQDKAVSVLIDLIRKNKSVDIKDAARKTLRQMNLAAACREKIVSLILDNFEVNLKLNPKDHSNHILTADLLGCASGAGLNAELDDKAGQLWLEFLQDEDYHIWDATVEALRYAVISDGQQIKIAHYLAGLIKSIDKPSTKKPVEALLKIKFGVAANKALAADLLSLVNDKRIPIKTRQAAAYIMGKIKYDGFSIEELDKIINSLDIFYLELDSKEGAGKPHNALPPPDHELAPIDGPPEKNGLPPTNTALAELEGSMYAALQTYSNVHRGAGQYSEVTTELYEEARRIVMDCTLGSKADSKKYDVIFGSEWCLQKLEKMLDVERKVSANDIGLPLGVGALVVLRNEKLENDPPLSGGGTVWNFSTWESSPKRFEPGTPNIIGAIALARALLMIKRSGDPALFKNMQSDVTVDDIFDDVLLKRYSGRDLLNELRKQVIGDGSIVPTVKGDKPYINFDNAASMPAFESVWQAARMAIGLNQKDWPALVDRVRSITCDFFNASKDRYGVIFTQSTTEAVNMVAKSLRYEQPAIIKTVLEHNSNSHPYDHILYSTRPYVNADTDKGLVDVNSLQRELAYSRKSAPSRQILVAVTGASNVLGTLTNVKEVCEIAHKYGAKVLVDAAQLAAHAPINMDELDVDYLVFSSHKMYAPFGSGGVVGRKDLLDRVKVEAGVPESQNIAGIAALGKSMLLLKKIGLNVIMGEERELTAYALDNLKAMPYVEIYGPKDAVNKIGVISFNVRKRNLQLILGHANVASILAGIGGIGVRTGCFCAHRLVRLILLGTEFFMSALSGMVRISFGLYNTKDQIKAMMDILRNPAFFDEPWAVQRALSEKNREYIAEAKNAVFGEPAGPQRKPFDTNVEKPSEGSSSATFMDWIKQLQGIVHAADVQQELANIGKEGEFKLLKALAVALKENPEFFNLDKAGVDKLFGIYKMYRQGKAAQAIKEINAAAGTDFDRPGFLSAAIYAFRQGELESRVKDAKKNVFLIYGWHVRPGDLRNLSDRLWRIAMEARNKNRKLVFLAENNWGNLEYVTSEIAKQDPSVLYDRKRLLAHLMDKEYMRRLGEKLLPEQKRLLTECDAVLARGITPRVLKEYGTPYDVEFYRILAKEKIVPIVEDFDYFAWQNTILNDFFLGEARRNIARGDVDGYIEQITQFLYYAALSYIERDKTVSRQIEKIKKEDPGAYVVVHRGAVHMELPRELESAGYDYNLHSTISGHEDTVFYHVPIISRMMNDISSGKDILKDGKPVISEEEKNRLLRLPIAWAVADNVGDLYSNSVEIEEAARSAADVIEIDNAKRLLNQAASADIATYLKVLYQLLPEQKLLTHASPAPAGPQRKPFDTNVEKPAKARDRSGYGFSGGLLTYQESYYRELLIEAFNNKGFTVEEEDSLIDAIVRIKEGALGQRESLFSDTDRDLILHYKLFDIDSFIRRIKEEKGSYLNRKGKTEKRLFSDNDIHLLLFKKLVPLDWVEGLMKDGLSKSDATRIAAVWSNPKDAWDNELMPLRDELVRDGLPRSFATHVAIRRFDPKDTWNNELKPVRDELVRDGLSKTIATRVVTRWSNPKDTWDKLKPIRDELVQDGLSISNATIVITGRSNPKDTWNNELKPIRDELVKEGLSISIATFVVTTWSNPKDAWNNELKPIRDELVRDGLSISNATVVVTTWSNPKDKWDKLKPIRDELVQEGLPRSLATLIVTEWSNPKDIWNNELKPIRDELVLDGLSKTSANRVVTGWSNPKEKLAAVNATIPKIRAILGMSEREARLFLLNNKYGRIVSFLKERYNKTDAEIEPIMAHLKEYEDRYSHLEKEPAGPEHKPYPTNVEKSGNMSDVLRKEGFQELADGYFLKDAFLIHIIKHGKDELLQEVCVTIGNKSQEIVDIDIDKETFSVSSLRLTYANGRQYIAEISSGSSSSGGEVKNFASMMDKRSAIPFEERLIQSGFQEVVPKSGIFEITLEEGNKAVVVCKNGKILYIGKKSKKINYGENPKIVAYAAIKLDDLDRSIYGNINGLTLQEGPLKYIVDERNLYSFSEFDLSVEFAMPLAEHQAYTEKPNNAGFVIGGVNTNEAINRLTELTGVSIEEIEKRGQPGSYSNAGFLAKGEKFKDVLKADNTFVSSKGFTHQQLAEPLFYVMNIIHKIRVYGRNKIEFMYKGKKYQASMESWRGGQQSIFNDGLSASQDFTVTNVETGASVSFSGLVPYYIWRYGFYEGHTRYRVEPASIIDVFFADKAGTTAAIKPQKKPYPTNTEKPNKEDGPSLKDEPKETRKVPSVSEILTVYKNNPPGTLYKIHQLPNENDIKLLWGNGERFEFALFTIFDNNQIHYYIFQGGVGNFTIDLDLATFLENHSVPVFIHNHPMNKERPLPKNFDVLMLSDIEQWYYKTIAARGIPSPFPSVAGIGNDYLGIKTVGKMYTYTHKYGYVEYGKTERPAGLEFGNIRFQTSNRYGAIEEFAMCDDDALFGWGVSMLEEEGLYIFRKFNELIERGMERIEMTNWDGKFAIWDRSTALSNILSIPVAEPPADASAIAKPDRTHTGAPAEVLKTIKDDDKLFASAMNGSVGLKFEGLASPEVIKILEETGILIPVAPESTNYTFGAIMRTGDEDDTKTFINAMQAIDFSLPIAVIREHVKMTIINEMNKQSVLPENKILWHIIVKDVIPRQQQDSIVTQVNKSFRDKPDATERILIVDEAKLANEIARIRGEHPDALIDVAVNNESQLAAIPDDALLPRENRVKPLIFKESGNFIQLEGIIAALRQLHSDNPIPALLRIYSVMAGKSYNNPPDAVSDDPKEFARRLIFDLPRATSVPVDEIPKLNKRLLVLLAAA